MQTTSSIINSILGAKTDIAPAKSDIAMRNEFNNLITKNLKLNNPSRGELRDVAGDTSSPTPVGPSLGEDPKDRAVGLRDLISGAEIQIKQPNGTRQQVYITLQTHDQVIDCEAMNYTAYLVTRERGRDFKRLNEFDEAVYELSVENKHWLIGHLTERTTKSVFPDVVVTLDPKADTLTLWFSDYSGIIEIPINNKALTAQQKYFQSAGVWGKPLSLPSRTNRSFLDCQSRVRGAK